MGIVYRALDLALNRVVALKVLREGRYDRALLVARFQREALAIAQLNHPNIVQTHSAGFVDKIPYIAMELIEGQPLSQVMVDERRLPWKRALGIAEQIASALACAHDRQIIHRDIKPPNILIAENDHVYVADFGLAKLLTLDIQLTVDGARLGTPQYMSPEQCQRGELTVSSDLYSLGVVLFVMITGRIPYPNRDKAQLIMNIVSGKPARVRDYMPHVPEDVERLVAYLLERRPEDRPGSAQEVHEAIVRVRAGRPLDQSDQGVRKALAGLRRDASSTLKLASATPLEKGPDLRDRVASARRRLRDVWRRMPRLVRGMAITGLMGVVGLALGMAAASVLRPDPQLDVRPGSYGAHRWHQSAEVASFTENESGVLAARFNLPGFTVTNAAWLGSGKCEVELRGVEGAPHEGQSATCLVEPSLRQATLGVAPVDTQDGTMEATAVPTLEKTSSFSFPRQAHSGMLRASDLDDHVQITYDGEGRVCGVSDDGAWAAVIPDGAQEPTVLLVDLSRSSL